MNQQIENHDKLNIASKQSTGLVYLLTRAIMHAEEHPYCGPTENEKEGIEMLSMTINSELNDAVRRITSTRRGAEQTGEPTKESAADSTAEKIAPESNSSLGGAVAAQSRSESPATHLQGRARGKTARGGKEELDENSER